MDTVTLKDKLDETEQTLKGVLFLLDRVYYDDGTWEDDYKESGFELVKGMIYEVLESLKEVQLTNSQH